MQTVYGTTDLATCTDEYVYVSLYDKIYKRIGPGEYAEKRYFTSGDIKKMYGIESHTLSRILRRVGRKKKIRLTLKQVKELFENT